MPFQSEKQRRYLWANEPEIARDWTDTYGSGIAKALGGRIQYQRGGPGPGGQGARGQATQNPGRSAPSGGGGGRDVMPVYTPPSPVTRGEHHPSISTGRERAIADITYDRPEQLTVTRPSQHIGTGLIDQLYNVNKRTIDRQQQYQQGAYQRAHPFLSKVRSGLGSLGRGLGNIGNMAMMFNPYTAALGLAGKARLGTMFNMGSRYANQGGNWLNEFRQYDTLMDYLNRNKNQTTEQMDPELAKYFSGTEGIMDPNILPEERPVTDEIFTDENLMAEGPKPLDPFQQLTNMGYGDMIENMSDQEVNQLYDSVIGTWSTV